MGQQLILPSLSAAPGHRSCLERHREKYLLGISNVARHSAGFAFRGHHQSNITSQIYSALLWERLLQLLFYRQTPAKKRREERRGRGGSCFYYIPTLCASKRNAEKFGYEYNKGNHLPVCVEKKLLYIKEDSQLFCKSSVRKC